ncbi:SIMPL domain-containing protein [[Haemophilus] ducreyi]|uniref:SIMPL domain-containing protein n=1 Tax=Haemophilus ducreyi TaxID=730 RepID=UPI0006552E56|nr:SIMPL domain-containing protein [[Haemophilus] ducreyi]AKO45147.1 periplasmic/secreted protein [[Haemophilus] ducreyi]AKO46548.1 periplasmic/secreted protein [[Haemophilus] ducreyi]AKO47890.1 periplasmic/secreted protein [[Haemophilus] ducreyi]AKO49278.1 periplasmic/secreted protein [[Haemophilus] ducreyi]ANF61721.1 hypothetical protein A6037_02655 [[Haemophilus] ducreyi]
MKLKQICLILPLMVTSITATANQMPANPPKTVFEFSTEINRTIEKDVMQAVVYSRKTGKQLPDLKKSVSLHLNKVIDNAKKQSDIELEANGVRNFVNYDNNNKPDGWVAEGQVYLKSKNFEALAKVLEQLDSEVAISDIYFNVSPEKAKTLENEMILDVLKQFKHKAEVVQAGLNAKNYVLTDVKLDTPNGNLDQFEVRSFAMMARSVRPASAKEELSLEPGKATLSARASGKVQFE